ncbi:MAG: hypothetical protein A2314_04890 [Elusimicrobia bacterium RIFOXYB2_FULL_50_12]|nr:MAG: hypothetical protein A2314_04890 [Elusimicrobia bacterium RIFOXYB2_FULL_50_12]
MKKIIFLTFLFIILIAAYFPIGVNTWRILTNRGFVIPGESSIFIFRTTVMNDGSGEWWLYGEDNNFYYHFIGSKEKPYIKISKNEATKCVGFDPNDHMTWCSN